MRIFKFLKKSIITPNIKGRIGESRLEDSLDLLDFFGYHGYCLRNVYIPRRNGTTSEIDVLYITSKGLFVIESKNFSGYIFGNERYKYWTSTLYAGKNWAGFKKVEKHKFYNPVWQNNSHINALRNYCGNINAFSIIAFGNNGELKDIQLMSDNVYVCYYSNLKKTVKQIWNNSPDLYNEEEIKDIYFKLSSLDNSRETRRNHINNIYSKPNVCPKCGNSLVVRTAKRGVNAGQQFYGCSNYPNCRYTRNI